MTQLTQFVGRDIMNKNTSDLAVRCSTESVEFSWVELCHYKHPLTCMGQAILEAILELTGSQCNSDEIAAASSCESDVVIIIILSGCS